MQNSFQDMAQRQINAQARFVECVVEDGFTADEADTLAKAYVHLGVLKFDPVDGQFYIKHGALFDREIMRNVIDNAAQIFATRRRKYRR